MRTQEAGIFLMVALGTFYLPSLVEPSIYLVDLAPIAFSIPQAPTAANDAASSGKRILEHLVQNDKTLTQALGFRSADEATDANMKIGGAIAVMSISIDGLKGYTPGRDLAELFKPTDQFLYPIKVGEKVRSAITVKKMRRTGQWQAAAFGAFGAPLAAERLNILNSVFIARLYELELWYLGSLRGTDLTLFPITFDPVHHDVAIGKQQNARDVLAKLMEEAKRLDSSDYRKHSRP